MVVLQAWISAVERMYDDNRLSFKELPERHYRLPTNRGELGGKRWYNLLNAGQQPRNPGRIFFVGCATKSGGDLIEPIGDITKNNGKVLKVLWANL